MSGFCIVCGGCGGNQEGAKAMLRQKDKHHELQIISYWKRDNFHGGQYVSNGVCHEWWNLLEWGGKGVPSDGKPFGNEMQS